jgi:hypothetical protein
VIGHEKARTLFALVERVEWSGWHHRDCSREVQKQFEVQGRLHLAILTLEMLAQRHSAVCR